MEISHSEVSRSGINSARFAGAPSKTLASTRLPTFWPSRYVSGQLVTTAASDASDLTHNTQATSKLLDDIVVSPVIDGARIVLKSERALMNAYDFQFDSTVYQVLFLHPLVQDLHTYRILAEINGGMGQSGGVVRILSVFIKCRDGGPNHEPGAAHRFATCPSAGVAYLCRRTDKCHALSVANRRIQEFLWIC